MPQRWPPPPFSYPVGRSPTYHPVVRPQPPVAPTAGPNCGRHRVPAPSPVRAGKGTPPQAPPSNGLMSRVPGQPFPLSSPRCSPRRSPCSSPAPCRDDRIPQGTGTVYPSLEQGVSRCPSMVPVWGCSSQPGSQHPHAAQYQDRAPSPPPQSARMLHLAGQPTTEVIPQTARPFSCASWQPRVTQQVPQMSPPMAARQVVVPCSPASPVVGGVPTPFKLLARAPPSPGEPSTSSTQTPEAPSTPDSSDHTVQWVLAQAEAARERAKQVLRHKSPAPRCRSPPATSRATRARSVSPNAAVRTVEASPEYQSRPWRITKLKERPADRESHAAFSGILSSKQTEKKTRRVTRQVTSPLQKWCAEKFTSDEEERSPPLPRVAPAWNLDDTPPLPRVAPAYEAGDVCEKPSCESPASPGRRTEEPMVVPCERPYQHSSTAVLRDINAELDELRNDLMQVWETRTTATGGATRSADSASRPAVATKGPGLERMESFEQWRASLLRSAYAHGDTNVATLQPPTP